MKGIILSGGTGSRLYPLTTVVNKQLLAVYDKPMIYYPLSTMISCGIKDFCIISSPEYIPMYEKMFGDGNHLGLNIVYEIQYKPNGIAESFIIAEDFIGNDNVSLILGDNIFHGIPRIKTDFKGSLVFAYEVTNPWDYAVVQFEGEKIKQIVEKPKEFISNYAIPGLYFFDNKVINYSKTLKPSKRGELEITDIINIYLNNNSIDVIKFPRGTAWLDAGQPDTLFQSAAYVKTIQERQGIRIGCIEEECYNKGFIDKNQLKKVVDKLPESEYKKYLERLL
jgi:glucose-1-phosphate thymidylyltransferase